MNSDIAQWAAGIDHILSGSTHLTKTDLPKDSTVPQQKSVRCIVCSEDEKIEDMVVGEDEDWGICKWCHFNEFGVWPAGKTDPDWDPEDKDWTPEDISC